MGRAAASQWQPLRLVGGAVSLVVFCLNWGYYAIFEALWKGQTPGKRWAKIRVIKDSGRPINAFEAISRNLIRFVDFLPFFYGVGVITMLLNAKAPPTGRLRCRDPRGP